MKFSLYQVEQSLQKWKKETVTSERVNLYNFENWTQITACLITKVDDAEVFKNK